MILKKVTITTDHAAMSRTALQYIYLRAWSLYASPEHVATLLRRAKARGVRPRRMMKRVLAFYASLRFEKVHPLEGGWFRRKYRVDRRSGMPLENPLLFYSRYVWEILDKHLRFAAMAWRYHRICRRVEQETSPYMDLALTPAKAEDMDALEIFTVTTGSQATVEKAKRKQAAKNDAGVKVAQAGL